MAEKDILSGEELKSLIMADVLDVIVIGGGQSGLACGYFLNRSGLNYKILDRQETCGGSWQDMWDSLSLFSSAEHSSLPGWRMPKSIQEFPSKQEVVDYLCKYESRYDLPVIRPVTVNRIIKEKEKFKIFSTAGNFYSKAIISATGTWDKPFFPPITGAEKFEGLQIHSSNYKNPAELLGKKVLIIGEGNSGAQILSEVSRYTVSKWATLKEPTFLPDDVDGKVLFNIASAKYKAEKEGKAFNPSNYNLSSIVMVPSVKEGRSRKVLESAGTLKEINPNSVIWNNGDEEVFDVLIWCTGFHFATDYLRDVLQVKEKGEIKTEKTRALEVEGIWLVGYGGWTGYASATLIGVGRTARETVTEVEQYLQE